MQLTNIRVLMQSDAVEELLDARCSPM